MDNPVYEDIASKFFEHFLYIAAAMNNMGGDGIGLWDEDDQFFYDVLNLPDGSRCRLRVRSLVGLIPLFAVEVLDAEVASKLPEFLKPRSLDAPHRPDLAGWCRAGRYRGRAPHPAGAASRASDEGVAARYA